MIRVPADDLRRIVDAAESAYPRECCGLLAGRRHGRGDVTVNAVHPSRNLAARPRRRFEVDSALRLRLERRLRGTPSGVVGLYHSHPDHNAQPSPTDLGQAWEPDLVWLIVSVLGGQAVHVTAHRLLPDGSRFVPIALRTTDWRPYPRRPPDRFEPLADPRPERRR